jgi:hypothetical protein
MTDWQENIKAAHPQMVEWAKSKGYASYPTASDIIMWYSWVDWYNQQHKIEPVEIPEAPEGADE